MEKTKVTIIDDELEYVNDVARGLEILGYEVSKAGNGAHAIEVINREKPDIVLCDYKLDDMDGTQVISKTKIVNPLTKYVIVTAYFDEGLEKTFRQAGADEVIFKPIKLVELDNTIRKIISG